jgi:hypothetical protein
MTIKSHLLAIVEDAIHEFQSLNTELPFELLHQKGTLNNWAARDDVIHCVVYARRFADHLTWPRDHQPEGLGGTPGRELGRSFGNVGKSLPGCHQGIGTAER